MGLFRTKRRAEYINRIIDIHCHILPEVDDGSKSMEQSQSMLDIAWKQGIHTIIVTPHFMPDGRNASKEVIEEKIAELQEYVDDMHYDMNILSGNEIYYHEEVSDLLDNGEICTLADSHFVLVEFSPMDDARYIRNSLSELQRMGYHPIIAHVERYMSLCKAPYDKIEELKDMGILVQINAASVMGMFGKESKAVTEKLLKKRLVDFIGTDAHSDGTRAPKILECARYLEKKLDADYLEELLYRNAEKNIL